MNGVYKVQDKHFFRAAFPRSRMLTQLEDDLTVFIQFIESFSRLGKQDFENKFDSEYAKIYRLAIKTVKNRRTEMISLFGLTVQGDSNTVDPSPRTKVLLDTQDFNLFFKSFCNKFQFPNCINKPQETIRQLQNSVRFKPAKFILQLMLEGVKKYGKDFSVTGAEISNLVFNDLRVLSGKDSASKVLARIIDLRKHEMGFDGGSFMTQHGREFLGYMMLAGLLKSTEPFGFFCLNQNEKASIDYIMESDDFFEISEDYDISQETRKKTQREWELWFGDISKIEEEKFKFVASEIPEIIGQEEVLSEAGEKISVLPLAEGLKDIGDLGERIVLKYEQDTIGRVRPDKIALVKIVSNDTELGYDIQSFNFEDLQKKKLIEVKTTKRTFTPNSEIMTFFTMSSNEWETARHHGDSYCIYRVFLLRGGAQIFVISDPITREKEGKIIIEPLQYRLMVKNTAGNYVSNI